MSKSTNTQKTFVVTTPLNYNLEISEKWLLLLTLGLALICYGWSFISNGFYQGEEGSHYINMLDFWNDPKVIMGNWAKTGWKILYLLPAKLGQQPVIFLNCLFSAFTFYFSYKICVQKQLATPLISLILILTQPVWFLLSHRLYSEIPTAFLLSAAYYFFLRNKHIASALIFSYLLLLRQEFYIVAVPFGLYLLFNKKIVPALLLGLFPVLYNLLGYYFFNDWLYLFTDAKKTAETYKNMYPRQGFDHYFKMSLIIFGALPITGFLSYIALVSFKKIKTDWFLLSTVVIYFLTHCLFNLQAYSIGTSTGGNLRYLIVIAPFITILAAIAYNNLATQKTKWFLLIPFVPFLIFVLTAMCYEHNWILFDPAKPNPLLFLIALSSIIVTIFPFKNAKTFFIALTLLGIIHIALITKPLKLNSENLTQKEVVDWAIENNVIDTKHIVCHLPLFNYFLDKTDKGFVKGKTVFSKQACDNATVGTYFFWDTHYAKKFGQVEAEYFTSKPDTFKMLQQWTADDNSMITALFEKVK
jgi:hypothetical protein